VLRGHLPVIAQRDSMMLLTVWTVGHSTLSIEDFITSLATHRISALVDVRRFPSSRRHPQFNKTNLSGSLNDASITYFHIPQLGGRRPITADSTNTGLRNPGFRGYADYMETKPFVEGVDQLLDLAQQRQTAIMCAEALWWRCHRSLISDYLTSKGVRVLHILGPNKEEQHHYTSAARLIEGRLTYKGLL